jgi:sulfatase modifying factor 1
MQCDACGFDNPEGMAFCGKCGVKLELPKKPPPEEATVDEVPEVKCPKCGSTMPATARFCGVCGLDFKRPSEPPSQPAAEESPSQPAAEESSSQPAAEESPSQPAAEPSADRSSPSQVAGALNSTEDYSQVAQATVEERREAEAELTSPEGALREMVLIPAGWFAMGAHANQGNPDEHPRHQVELSAYYVDRSSVSNAEYEKFDPRHRRLRPEVADGDHDPVVFVTYQEVLGYCRWRAQQEGVLPNTYTLPTEAQWERAARGGYPDRVYPWGNEIVPEACNCRETARQRTVPVDEGVPNGFGLFHMGSNVREWCLDYYSENYYETREASGPDPRGPHPSMMVNMNVVRGASFQDLAKELGRCAARNYAHPKSASSDIGFRCVRKGPVQGS